LPERPLQVEVALYKTSNTKKNKKYSHYPQRLPRLFPKRVPPMFPHIVIITFLFNPYPDYLILMQLI